MKANKTKSKSNQQKIAFVRSRFLPRNRNTIDYSKKGCFGNCLPNRDKEKEKKIVEVVVLHETSDGLDHHQKLLTDLP